MSEGPREGGCIFLYHWPRANIAGRLGHKQKLNRDTGCLNFRESIIRKSAQSRSCKD